jgi:post-segregation antitoxin (ccd killing protein)
MGVLNVKIDDELDKEFRKKVIDVYGTKKGVLAKAVEEAIELWLQKYKSEKEE